MALHLDGALVGLVGAGERAQQGGLARAVVADQPQPVAGLQLQVQVGERGDFGRAVRSGPSRPPTVILARCFFSDLASTP